MGASSRKQKTDYVIIVGCGRLGSTLAAQMSDQDKNVSVIDINERAFRKLPLSYGGYTIEGDGADMDVLTSCNAKDAAVLIATTQNDDTNIMVAQIAKEIYKIKKVIVRLKDHTKLVTIGDMDIEAICPAMLSVKEFERIIAQDDSKEVGQ
jgi:trk system potassium uptake protein TrkA